MRVSEWLQLTAAQLSDYQAEHPDQQFVHWSKEMLLHFYSDVICYIASIKPQDFIRPVVVRLTPGSTQVTCCSWVGAVHEHVTEAGSFISIIKPSKTLPTWRGNAACRADVAYTPQQTYRSSEAPNSFDIYPPVPATGAYYVKILCSQAPTAPTLADLAAEMPHCKYDAAISAYVMYRALSGETDTALFGAAAASYKVFTDLMGIQSKAETAFQKAIP